MRREAYPHKHLITAPPAALLTSTSGVQRDFSANIPTTKLEYSQWIKRITKKKLFYVANLMHTLQMQIL